LLSILSIDDYEIILIDGYSKKEYVALMHFARDICCERSLDRYHSDGNFETDVTVIGFVAIIPMRSCDVMPIFLAITTVVITVT